MALLPRRNIHDSSKKIVLIIGNDRLGDSFVRLPFYEAVRRCFPRENWRIAVVLTPPIARALKTMPYFDEIIVSPLLCESHSLFWIFKQKMLICPLLRWAFKHRVDVLLDLLRLRSLGCDYVRHLTRPVVSMAYSAIENVKLFPMSAAYQLKHCDRQWTYLMQPKMGRHQFDDLNEILHIVMASPTIKKNAVIADGKSLLLPVEDMKEMLDERPSLTVGLNDYVTLVPGAGATYRQWDLDSFVELVDKMGGNFVVVGSESESALGKYILENAKSNIVNLCGKTTILQLGSVLAKSRVVITNETGTATYAAILGVPTVCILGGGDFGAFFPNPYCPNTVSVYHKEDCFNCGWKCPKKRDANAVAPCIERITVDEVMNAAKLAITAVEREKPHA